MINGQNFFDQSVKKWFKEHMIKFEKLQLVKEIMTPLLSTRLSLFQQYNIAIDLSKWQELDADPKTIKQIHFTRTLTREEGATMFFIIEEAKSINSFQLNKLKSRIQKWYWRMVSSMVVIGDSNKRD